MLNCNLKAKLQFWQTLNCVFKNYIKLPLDQNLRVIYQKFNGDFKSHINFEGTKGGQGDDV
jgi:hypothetical protein